MNAIHNRLPHTARSNQVYTCCRQKSSSHALLYTKLTVYCISQPDKQCNVQRSAFCAHIIRNVSCCAALTFTACCTLPYVCMYVCVCVCVYVYTHTHTHTSRCP